MPFLIKPNQLTARRLDALFEALTSKFDTLSSIPGAAKKVSELRDVFRLSNPITASVSKNGERRQVFSYTTLSALTNLTMPQLRARLLVEPGAKNLLPDGTLVEFLDDDTAPPPVLISGPVSKNPEFRIVYESGDAAHVQGWTELERLTGWSKASLRLRLVHGNHHCTLPDGTEIERLTPYVRRDRGSGPPKPIKKTEFTIKLRGGDSFTIQGWDDLIVWLWETFMINKKTKQLQNLLRTGGGRWSPDENHTIIHESYRRKQSVYETRAKEIEERNNPFKKNRIKKGMY